MGIVYKARQAALMLLTAFAAHPLGATQPAGRYHGLNLIGAAGVAFSSLPAGADPAVLNTEWMAIAAAALARRALGKPPEAVATSRS
jgi:hypothetical protein